MEADTVLLSLSAHLFVTYVSSTKVSNGTYNSPIATGLDDNSQEKMEEMKYSTTMITKTRIRTLRRLQMIKHSLL